MKLLTKPSQPDPDVQKFGNLTLVATTTVDGGFSLSVFSGPHREAELCFTTADRKSARARYRLIAEAALAGTPPHEIADLIHGRERAVLAATAQVVNAATALIPTQRRRQVPPTMAGAHLTPAADPTIRAVLVAYTNGKVVRGGNAGEAPVQVLKAAARRGLLHLTPFEGSRKSNWSHGTITRAGVRELARLGLIPAEAVTR